jgi:multidrug efflux pump subunit AcrB
MLSEEPTKLICDRLSIVARPCNRLCWRTYLTAQPPTTETYAIKWDGEWQVTYEVFRDLGIAFAVVLVLIYALVVGWFQSFTTPLVIMAAIPFSLMGIMPAHWLMGGSSGFRVISSANL